MKKIILFFILSLSLWGAFNNLVLAQQVKDPLLTGIASQSGYNENVTAYTLSETVGKIIKVILGLLGTIFLALTVYAGVLWMTAGGEEEGITKAKGILKNSVIGLIIVLASYSLTYFVLARIFEATL